MWLQLQKTVLVLLSGSGRSDFNIQHGETGSSCGQEEALHRWVGQWVAAAMEAEASAPPGGGGLLRSSPLYSIFNTAGS